MYKIKLPQPYASLVISGAINTIPIPKEEEVNIGQKIYIYASDFEDKHNLDLRNIVDRKLYNEMFFGNIPGNWDEYPIGRFIGYVNVIGASEKKESDKDFWKDTESQKIFINNAHRFPTTIKDFDRTLQYLEELKSVRSELRRMSRKGSILKVPVGSDMWENLHDPEEIPYIFLCWEDYMANYVEEFSFRIPSLDEIEDDYEEDEIEEVEFLYEKELLVFSTEMSCDHSFRIVTNEKGKIVSTLEFHLDQFFDGCCFRDKEDLKEYKKQKEESEKEWSNPYARVISTPMGGQNKWKR